ncbi:MAG: hypothetical protein E7672_02395 [Ruminococcaceae bacterium]|nr:hypothetical protein [Oscillospiraceae bacterium]
MKTIMTILLLTALLLSACSVSSPSNDDTDPNVPLSDDSSDQLPPLDNTDQHSLRDPVTVRNIHFVETSGYFDGYSFYPWLIRISSFDELRKYYTTFDNVLHSSAHSGFDSIINCYNQKWFDSHDLYIALIWEPSCSITHSAEITDDGLLVITEITPYDLEAIAEWNIIVEVEKGNVIRGIVNDGEMTENIFLSVENLEDYITDFIVDSAKKHFEEDPYLSELTLINVQKMTFADCKDYITNESGYSAADSSPIWRVEFGHKYGNAIAYVNAKGFVFDASVTEI